jgi:hypothetical protein
MEKLVILHCIMDEFRVCTKRKHETELCPSHSVVVIPRLVVVEVSAM